MDEKANPTHLYFIQDMSPKTDVLGDRIIYLFNIEFQTWGRHSNINTIIQQFFTPVK